MEQLLLLHGAIGSKEQFLSLEELLGDKYIIHSLNFPGHGGSSIPAETFSIPFFAEQVLAYMDQNNIEVVNIFGYSMGGYVGMYLAKHHHARINKLVTLATKFYWDESVSAKEVPQLNAGLIQEKLPAFAEQLKQRHLPQNWKGVLDKTKELMLGLGQSNALHLADYASITTHCLLLLGDRDKMITLEETMDVYKNLPNAQFGILPGTPHPLEKVDMNMLQFLINNFLSQK